LPFAPLAVGSRSTSAAIARHPESEASPSHTSKRRSDPRTLPSPVTIARQSDMTHDPNICPTDDELLAAYPVFAAEPFATGGNTWQMQVVAQSPAGSSGLFLSNVDGVGYPYTADVADSIEVIRDGIQAIMDATLHIDWVVSPQATDLLNLTSAQIAIRLDVQSNLGPTGVELTLEETRPLTPAQPIHDALQAASCYVCDTWGCSTWEACMAVAVHFLKTWNMSQDVDPGPSGQIASMGQGPFSISWATTAANNGDDAWWSSTPEGQKYLALRRLQGPQFVLMRGGNACSSRRHFRRVF
ncbi:MAG: DUF4054 domain-containing protein, partial [Acidimicrobiia bacterium]